MNQNLSTTDEVKLYTPKDIERIFSMSHQQANLLMHSSGFPLVRINRRLYVEDSALRKWLKTYEGKQFLISD